MGLGMENSQNKIKLFENKKIRYLWNEEEEDWYFSVVDVVNVLTESIDYQSARNYWKVLKNRLKTEGSELVTDCNRLKLLAADGKLRQTDCLSTKNILRLIQSIPSPKAEPFKMWLAQVGSDRLDEIADPEKAILRGADFYRTKGYPEGWINQRLQTIEIRKELTDEWKARGIEREKDFAILTNEMTKAWSGLSIKEYKQKKDLKKENLRDNMTNIELVLNMLAEVTATSISKQEQPQGIEENKNVAFSFWQNHTPAIAQKVKSGELDLGFGGFLKRDDMEFFPLIQQPLVIVSPEQHPIADEPEVPLVKLTRYPVIGYDRASWMGAYTGHLYRKYQLHPNIIMECPDEYSIVALVRENFGIALMPRTDILEQAGGIRIHTLKGLEIYHQTFMFWMKNRYRLPAVERFTEYMKQHADIIEESGNDSENVSKVYLKDIVNF